MKYNYILSFLLFIAPSLTFACQPITSSNNDPWALITIIFIGVSSLLLFYGYIQLYKRKKAIFPKAVSTLFKINIVIFVASFLWLTVGLQFFVVTGLIQSDFGALCVTTYSPLYEYIHPLIKAAYSGSFFVLLISGIFMVFKKIPVSGQRK